MKLNSAQCNKLIRKWKDEIQSLYSVENTRSIYTEVEGVTPVIPPYSYETTRTGVAELRSKIVKVKHALNVHNTEHVIDSLNMTVDEVLITMAQLTTEKLRVDGLRKHAPRIIKERTFGGNTHNVEYDVANYNIADAEQDYNILDKRITELQLALDLDNNTVQFEVDIKESDL